MPSWANTRADYKMTAGSVRHSLYAWRDAGLYDAMDGRAGSASVNAIDNQSFKPWEVAECVAMTQASRSRAESLRWRHVKLVPSDLQKADIVPHDPPLKRNGRVHPIATHLNKTVH